jgi:glycogen(starch) synthase
LRRAFFVSNALRDEYARAGYDCEGAPIIHHGIDTGRFAPGSDRGGEPGGRLLVCGRVVPEKGFHTAIEALALLSASDWGLDLTLDIVGPQPDPDYVVSLRRLIEHLGAEGRVQFQYQVPRDRMPEIYNSHDVLIIPSTWEEPLALTMLEGMACGLPVVGTTTGGSKEILEDGVTGLVFIAGDAGSLAAQLKRIRMVPGLARDLSRAARQRVQRGFTIDKTVARIESYLIDISAKKTADAN